MRKPWPLSSKSLWDKSIRHSAVFFEVKTTSYNGPQITWARVSALKGFRGRKRADVDVLVDVLMRVACMAQELGDLICELDINPLIVLEEGKGAKAADALLRVNPAALRG